MQQDDFRQAGTVTTWTTFSQSVGTCRGARDVIGQLATFDWLNHMCQDDRTGLELYCRFNHRIRIFCYQTYLREYLTKFRHQSAVADPGGLFRGPDPPPFDHTKIFFSCPFPLKSSLTVFGGPPHPFQKPGSAPDLWSLLICAKQIDLATTIPPPPDYVVEHCQIFMRSDVRRRLHVIYIQLSG